MNKIQTDIAAGIKHISECTSGQIARGLVDVCIHNIQNGTGDPCGSALLLVTHSTGNALLSWFRDGDLAQFKQRIYEAGKLQRLAIELAPMSRVGEQHYFCPLLADNCDLLEWFGKKVQPSEVDRDDPKTHSFRHGQMMYALAGDWEMVESRAKAVLDLQPASQKKFMVDEKFYLSLARGDVAGMEHALMELTSQKMARVRNDQAEFGYTHFFVGTHAVMYAKLAWLHGYCVNVDTPYIPSEWLPVAPLQEYVDPYALARAVDLR